MKPTTAAPTAKHTALPFEFRADFPDHPDLKNVVGCIVSLSHPYRADRIVVLASCCTPEDGQFIVTACNSHHDLVAACEAACSALYEAASDYNHPSFTDRRGAGPRMSAALKAVRLALSKAAGEKGKG